jgi:type IV pilus assembly protein PilC
MPKYRYTAIDASGDTESGVVEGRSIVAARSALLSRQLDVQSLAESRRWTKIEVTTKKIKPVDVMNFSRQMGAFLRAGIPILEALDALEDDCSNPVLRRTLVEVGDALRAGSSFSEAIAEHSGVFPPYYVGILRSAELTGNLDVVLDQLAVYIERDLETRRAVKAALTYPMVIAVMAVVTVTVPVGFVLPRFKTFFADFNAELPLATRILLGFTDFLTQWWPVILGGTVVVVVGSMVFFRTESGRYTRDRVALAMPVVGGVVRYGVVERFCRVLASMMHAGVPVPEAMDAAATATNNRVYQRGLVEVKQAMLRGEGLSRPIGDTKLFPGVASQMISVGERTGTLDDQLEITADFYNGELTHELKRLTSLFEPAIIIVMGVIVGFVAVALVSAMYGIFNQVKID